LVPDRRSSAAGLPEPIEDALDGVVDVEGGGVDDDLGVLGSS
jgi:hypothetical protein